MSIVEVKKTKAGIVQTVDDQLLIITDVPGALRCRYTQNSESPSWTIARSPSEPLIITTPGGEEKRIGVIVAPYL